MKVCFGICGLFVFLWAIWLFGAVKADWQFEAGCRGHLKRAADANTISLAQEELKVAVDYIEKYNLTSGTTAIIVPTPEYDMGFWYKNLKSSLTELQAITEQGKGEENLDRIEKTNTLMKLRETLLDHSNSGDTVTEPPRIVMVPDHVFSFYYSSITSGFAMLFFVAGLIVGVLE